MKELIVGGESGTHYIIEVNGEEKMVCKGDVVRFDKKKDAELALENVSTMSGALLFHEKVRTDNEMPEIKPSSISVAVPRDEEETGVLDTGEDDIEPTKAEKRELKKDGKNNKIS